jgi:hypothetical protein
MRTQTGELTTPECENFDPCFGKTKIKADFIVEENLNPYSKVLNEDIWIKGDTIKGKNINYVVRFTELSPADSFIWTIGAQKFYTKSVIQFGFTPGKHYPIQLIIINKNPNKRCLHRHIQHLHYLCRSHGTFRNETSWTSRLRGTT